MFILLILINPEKSLKLKKRLFWSGFSKPFPHIPFIYTTHSKYSLRLDFGLCFIIVYNIHNRLILLFHINKRLLFKKRLLWSGFSKPFHYILPRRETLQKISLFLLVLDF